MRRLLCGLTVLVIVVTACAQGGASDLPPELEAGHQVFSSRCATCHGGNGQGASAPALSGVLETFGSCSDQIRWITLGSTGWQDEVGETYGDTGKEITMVMPEFEDSLTEAEIARVAAFERHQFGGASQDDAMADCGVEPAS